MDQWKRLVKKGKSQSPPEARVLPLLALAGRLAEWPARSVYPEFQLPGALEAWLALMAIPFTTEFEVLK
jgi:hypothetical protein